MAAGVPRKKEEGRRKKEEGRRKKEEEEGRSPGRRKTPRKKEEGSEQASTPLQAGPPACAPHLPRV
jgi:hypothetical protein